MILIIFSILTLCSMCSADSRIVSLREIQPSEVFAVENGSNLYLASSDTLLANINFTSGGNSITGDQLLFYFNADGTQKPWKLGSDLKIETSNNADVMNLMNGYFYISTAEQANDPNFLVYVVDGNRTIDRSATNSSTILFLNLYTYFKTDNMLFTPYYSSILSKIVQTKNSTLSLFRGFPSPSINATSKNVFINPITLLGDNYTRSTVFFENIEPIQVPLNCFYLTIINGGLKFNIERDWKNLPNYTTTAFTTTGVVVNFFMSSINNVYFQTNPGHNRTSGFGVNAVVYYNSLNITMSGPTGLISVNYPVNSTARDMVYSDMVADKLNIWPSNYIVGDYAVQYFGIDGIALPGTSPVPFQSSTTTVPSNLVTSTTSIPPTTITQATTQHFEIFAIIFSFLISRFATL